LGKHGTVGSEASQRQKKLEKGIGKTEGGKKKNGDEEKLNVTR